MNDFVVTMITITIIVLALMFSISYCGVEELKVTQKAIESGYIQCLDGNKILWKKECK